MTTVILMTLIALIIIFKSAILFVPNHVIVIQQRLGKYQKTLVPGLHVLIPFVDRAAYTHEIREQVLDVPSQSCITRDNIEVEVDGLVYIKVIDAKRASYEITSYRNASVNLAQTTMRSEIGKMDLDSTFSERESLNSNIVKEIDKASDSWGIKVLRYEIRNITPSGRIIETMEKQMEAERDKRAQITLSDGERTAVILVSEGDRTQAINLSEGEQTEAINLSEGEKHRRTNEAEGTAQEIQIQADATADGVRAIAEAIQTPGGQKAVQLQLTESYIEQYGKILNHGDISVLPVDLAQLRSLIETMKLSLTNRGDRS